MLIVFVTIISIICHYAVPKTIEYYPPFESTLKCNECLRIYFPLCASNNKTYTNECRFRCLTQRKQEVMNKFQNWKKAKTTTEVTIVRMGPCILGARKKRSVPLSFIKDHEY